jgi:hypothetical protein
MNSSLSVERFSLFTFPLGTPADSKCSYLPTKENEALVNSFRDHALARIRDIEDLSILGKKLGICPYYATRSTIKPSEVHEFLPAVQLKLC